MIELLFIVLIVGSYVDAMSDQVVTMQPGYALQDYLCNGTLQSIISLLCWSTESIVYLLNGRAISPMQAAALR